VGEHDVLLLILLRLLIRSKGSLALLFNVFQLEEFPVFVGLLLLDLLELVL